MTLVKNIKLLEVNAIDNFSIFKILVDGEEQIYVGKQNVAFNNEPDNITDITNSKKLNAELVNLDSINKGYTIDKNVILDDTKKKDILFPVVVSKDIVQLGNHIFSMSKMTNNHIFYLCYKNHLFNRYVDDDTNTIYYSFNEDVINHYLNDGSDKISKILELIKESQFTPKYTNAYGDNYTGEFEAIESKVPYKNLEGNINALEFNNPTITNISPDMPFSLLYEYNTDSTFEDENDPLYVNYLMLKNHLSPFFNMEINKDNEFKLWRIFQKIENNNNKLWASYNFTTPSDISTIENNTGWILAPSAIIPGTTYEYYNPKTISAVFEENIIQPNSFKNGITFHLELSTKELKRRFEFGFKQRQKLLNSGPEIYSSKDIYNKLINSINNEYFEISYGKLNENDPSLNPGKNIRIKCIKKNPTNNYTKTNTAVISFAPISDWNSKGVNYCYLSNDKIAFLSGEDPLAEYTGEYALYDSGTNTELYNQCITTTSVPHAYFLYRAISDPRPKFNTSTFLTNFIGNYNHNAIGDKSNAVKYHYYGCNNLAIDEYSGELQFDEYNGEIINVKKDFKYCSRFHHTYVGSQYSEPGQYNYKGNGYATVGNESDVQIILRGPDLISLKDFMFKKISDSNIKTLFISLFNKNLNIAETYQSDFNRYKFTETEVNTYIKSFNGGIDQNNIITLADLINAVRTILNKTINDVKKISFWTNLNETDVNNAIKNFVFSSETEKEKVAIKIVVLIWLAYNNLNDLITTDKVQWNDDNITGKYFPTLVNYNSCKAGYIHMAEIVSNDNSYWNAGNSLDTDVYYNTFNFLNLLGAFDYYINQLDWWHEGDTLDLQNVRFIPFKGVDARNKNLSDENYLEEFYKSTINWYSPILMFQEAGKNPSSSISIGYTKFDIFSTIINGEVIGYNNYVEDYTGETIGTYSLIDQKIHNAISQITSINSTIDLIIKFKNEFDENYLIFESYLNGELINSSSFAPNTPTYEYLYDKLSVNFLNNFKPVIVGRNINRSDCYLDGPNHGRDFNYLSYNNISIWNYNIGINGINKMYNIANQSNIDYTNILNNTYEYKDGEYILNDDTLLKDPNSIGKLASINKNTIILSSLYKDSDDEKNKALYRIQNFEFIDKLQNFHRLSLQNGRKSNLYSVKIKGTGLSKNPYDKINEPDKYNDYEYFRTYTLQALESAVNTVCRKVEPLNTKLFKMIIED